jgi:ParB-like chromosome segregation protein Spo0J
MARATTPAPSRRRSPVKEERRARPRADRPVVTPHERTLPGYARTVDTWPTVMLTPLTEMKRYHNNPRRNTQAVTDVMDSLARYGARQTIVVDDEAVIVVGDTRYLAALQLQWPKFPCHVASGLSAAEAKAYRIADNKVGERAEWDFGRLKLEMDDLRGLGVDLVSTGFRDFEVAPILAADFLPATPQAQDLAETARKDGGSHRGQLKFTPDQVLDLARAADQYRGQARDQSLSVADCVARICREYVG